MKTIFNRFGNLRLALLVSFLAVGMTIWGQALPAQGKLSISTQMFLDEMAGKITFDEPAQPKVITSNGIERHLYSPRMIASPDTIDGKIFIAATLRIADERALAEVERLGVEVQCKFDKGLVTVNIPVDKILEVADVPGVKRVNVATLMRPLTNLSRQASNVDDVLTLSQDARNAGLLQTYDGTGVILSIIDTGIDYQHKAFKKADGTNRVVRVYNYNGSSATEWTGSGTMPTTDDDTGDHGTHTSSIAGGSSVTVSGTNVTVTDNHANATYGGMAPGADLYLCGVNGLSTNYLMNSFQKVVNYANQQNKPLVVSNSWGSGWGPRDGTSDVSDVINQYFGDSHPNRVCLFAASNDAGKAAGGTAGGLHVEGTATQSSPLGTIVRPEQMVVNAGYPSYYGGLMMTAWTRNTSATGVGMNVYVINKSNGSIVQTFSGLTANTTLNTSTYFGSNILAYFDYVESDNKHQAMLYLNASYASKGTSYYLAFEVYPRGTTSSVMDIWAGGYNYLTGTPSTSGHTWQTGSDDMSAGDEATMSNVVSIGSYVTRSSGGNSVGDISDFSSYAVEGQGPLGVMVPWISAPGEVIISGFNHYTSDHEGTVTINNSSAPYGEMSGTSMATPAAAGVVALWMQAATEFGHQLTHSEIKQIMKETAIHDEWTDTRSNHTHFGNGKINALAGIQYIQNHWGRTDPVIYADPESLTMTTVAGGTVTATINVSGMHLTGAINATLSGAGGVFSISPVKINDNGTITVTFSPVDIGTTNATITLSSTGATSVVITLTGIATDPEADLLISNTVTVDVPHTDAQVLAPYTLEQIENDVDYYNGLKPITNTQVDVLAKKETGVTSYHLYHKQASSTGSSNWATGNMNDAVARADRQTNSYVPYSKNANNNNWTQGTAVNIPASTSEVWVSLTDNIVVEDDNTLYAPVVVANGGSTYGSPIKVSRLGSCNISVGYDVSKEKYTAGEYKIWTAQVNFNNCQVPVIDNENYHYEPYKVRAWREYVPYVVGVGAQSRVIEYMGEQALNGNTSGVVGTENFVITDNVWVPNEFCFYTPADETPTFYGRFYYRLVANNASSMLAAGGGGGGGVGDNGADGVLPGSVPTGLHEFAFNRGVMDVMYVNPQGMTSRHPFDGINIVVTRYDDGTTTTQKVMMK